MTNDFKAWCTHTRSLGLSDLFSTRDPISIAISSLTLSIAFCNISFVLADIWRYKAGSFSVALLRSGYQIPLVPTEAPVSSWIYNGTWKTSRSTIPPDSWNVIVHAPAIVLIPSSTYTDSWDRWYRYHVWIQHRGYLSVRSPLRMKNPIHYRQIGQQF